MNLLSLIKAIIASATAKVILFDEHAVVYNKLEIVYNFNKRCSVSVISAKKCNGNLF